MLLPDISVLQQPVRQPNRPFLRQPKRSLHACLFFCSLNVFVVLQKSVMHLEMCSLYSSLCCTWACLVYSSLCCPWTCLFDSTFAASSLFYCSLCCMSMDISVCLSLLQQSVCPRRCLSCSSLCFTLTYLLNSSLCCPEDGLQQLVVHLAAPGLSFYKEPVLHRNVSVCSEMSVDWILSCTYACP
jgi:hypothetical protein